MFFLIRRTFKFLDIPMFLPLYKAIVRSHLDSCISVWAPYKIEQIKQVERVQRLATKMIPGLKGLSYAQRLTKLKLPTLLYRRIRGDLIETFKILSIDGVDQNLLKMYGMIDIPSGVESEDDAEIKSKSGKYDPQTVKFLKRWRDMGVRVSPRNNALALFPQQAKLGVRTNSFSVRVIRWWNELTNYEVLSPNVNTFKHRIDKFFDGKDVVYDFDRYMDRMRNEQIK